MKYSIHFFTYRTAIQGKLSFYVILIDTETSDSSFKTFNIFLDQNNNSFSLEQKFYFGEINRNHHGNYIWGLWKYDISAPMSSHIISTKSLSH